MMIILSCPFLCVSMKIVNSIKELTVLHYIIFVTSNDFKRDVLKEAKEDAYTILVHFPNLCIGNASKSFIVVLVSNWK